MKKYLLLTLVIATLALAGCSNTQVNEGELELDSTQNSEETQTNVQNTSSQTNVVNTEAVEYPTGDYIANLGDSVTFSDGDDILITQSGTYKFTGDYMSSTITVNVNKDTDEGVVYLLLNNVNIDSESSTPINIIEAKDVVIVLEGENKVTQGEITTTDEEFPSAAIYSKADTVITGDGSLAITTSYNDGINSRDDLIIEGTTITVDAVADGILGKDLLAISESDITVVAGKDGMKTSNAEEVDKGNLIITSGNFDITAKNDGISAEQILQIDGGTFNIISGGGFVEVLNEITRGEGSGNTISVTSQLEESMKGLKGLNIILNDGEFSISSYEDAIHSDGNLTINAGQYDILSGDDALHADVDLVINDITLEVENAYEGIEGETIAINNGDIIVNVLDDAINASSESGYVKITDGIISLKAQGDGIDSNGDLIVEGGEIVIEVNAVYAGGDSELDVSGVFDFSGGTIVDENGNEISPTAQGSGASANAMHPQRPSGNRP